MAKPATARTEQIEIVDNEFDLSNCQVVRREFFAHTFEPTIKHPIQYGMLKEVPRHTVCPCTHGTGKEATHNPHLR